MSSSTVSHHQAAQNHVNGALHPSPAVLQSAVSSVSQSPDAPAVWVSATAAGPSVKTVQQSIIGPPASSHIAWANVALTKPSHKVELAYKFKSGSPIETLVQNFAFQAGYDGTISVPFALPFWNTNSILGAAELSVRVDGVQAGTWAFDVIA